MQGIVLKGPHKYLRKYKGKNGKWVYIYKEKRGKSHSKTPKTLFSDVPNLEFEANSHRFNPFETLILFDEKGNVIHREKGNSERVSIEKIRDKLDNAPITFHNHPLVDASFSPNDVGVAMNHRTKRMVVASPNYNYEMTFDWDKIYKHYGGYKKFSKEINKYYAHYATIIKLEMESEIQHGSKITDKEIDRRFFSGVWRSVAREIVGMEYKQEKIKFDMETPYDNKKFKTNVKTINPDDLSKEFKKSKYVKNVRIFPMNKMYAFSIIMKNGMVLNMTIDKSKPLTEAVWGSKGIYGKMKEDVQRIYYKFIKAKEVK